MLLKLLYRIMKGVMTLLSFEFLLTSFNWPNGGTVIFFRSLFISLIMFCGYMLVVHGLDPGRGSAFSFYEMKVQIVKSIEIFGAIFAGIYIALYSRFSSQWSYLAGLYNQIKQTEATNVDTDLIMDQWKAGFIEDAIALHLAKKPMFAMIIRAWANKGNVRASFESDVQGGKEILDSLLKDIKDRFGSIETPIQNEQNTNTH